LLKSSSSGNRASSRATWAAISAWVARLLTGRRSPRGGPGSGESSRQRRARRSALRARGGGRAVAVSPGSMPSSWLAQGRSADRAPRRPQPQPTPAQLHRSITRNRWAGTPATVAPAGTSCVTTAPAPTSAPAPIRTPPRITAPEPTLASSSTTVRSRVQSCSVWSPPPVRRRARPLVVDEYHAVPYEHGVTDRYAVADEVWLWILQRAPTVAPRWISTKVPTRVPSPIRQPYRFVNEWTMTCAPKRTSSRRRCGASLAGIPDTVEA
jgi:hypothetical protein